MKTLQQLRDRITELFDEREEIGRAWPSVEECQKGIADQVELIARNGRARINAAGLRQGKVDIRSIDAGTLAAMLDPERLAAQLAEVALSEFPEAGVSAAERAKRLTAIADELHLLEVDEERLIRASPMPIARRADARPEIVLDPRLTDSAALAA